MGIVTLRYAHPEIIFLSRECMVKDSSPIRMLKKSMVDNAWRKKEILAINYLEKMTPINTLHANFRCVVGVGDQE